MFLGCSLLLVIAIASVCAGGQHVFRKSTPNGCPQSLPKIKNVILGISDGFSPGHNTLYREVELFRRGTPGSKMGDVLDSILVGSIRTKSHDSVVTDSSASATAYATGYKTNNTIVGIDPTGHPIGTVLESAFDMGLKTGLITTARVTHATPASFAAHAFHRDEEALIAEHMIGDSPLGYRVVDLMFGGGMEFFIPEGEEGSLRHDDRDLRAEATTKYGWKSFVDTLEKAKDAELPVAGVFAKSHVDYELDRKEQPSLIDMAKVGLDKLIDAAEKEDTGFFVMVEGARIDMAAHTNDIGALFHEVDQYQQFLEHAKSIVDSRNGDTVLITTSDHCTGGESDGLQVDKDAYPDYIYYPIPILAQKRSIEAVADDLYPLMKGDAGKAKDAVRRALEEDLEVKHVTDDEVERVFASADIGSLQFGWTFGNITGNRARVGWATHGHDGSDVHLGEYGGRCRGLELIGSWDNTYIAEHISELLGLDLQAVTDKMNAKTHARLKEDESKRLLRRQSTDQYHISCSAH